MRNDFAGASAMHIMVPGKIIEIPPSQAIMKRDGRTMGLFCSGFSGSCHGHSRALWLVGLALS